MIRPSRFLSTLVLCSMLLLSGCTSLLTTTIIKPTVGNLQHQQDVELVCEGAAAYLLMIDSLIEGNPTNRELLLLGSQSYSGTMAALESCGASSDRLQALGNKARQYGRQLLLTILPPDFDQLPPAELDRVLASTPPRNAPYLFWGTYGWLAWVTQQQGSPAAMADLVSIEALMAAILELDETVENGGAHLFFGVLYGAKPHMVGGDPDRSRHHFERALELSERSLLLVQVSYAQTYARQTFDQHLHDNLLHEVLTFAVETRPEHRLINEIAQKRARRLLDENFFD